MTPDAFAMQEIMMGLTMLGVGEVYSTRVQRLAGAVHALEKRVFSEAFLAQLSPATLMEMYKIAVSESDKSAKHLAAVMASVDLDTIRTRLSALGVAPEAQPGTPGAQFAQRGQKKRTRGKRAPAGRNGPGGGHSGQAARDHAPA